MGAELAIAMVLLLLAVQKRVNLAANTTGDGLWQSPSPHTAVSLSLARLRHSRMTCSRPVAIIEWDQKMSSLSSGSDWETTFNYSVLWAAPDTMQSVAISEANFCAHFL